MKKINIILGWLVCLLLCSSCNKFLELTPRDKKVVTSVEDYRDIMASYMRFLKTPNRSQIPVFGIDPYTTPKFNVSDKLGIYTGETILNTSSASYYDKNKNEYTPSGKNLVSWLNTDPYVWNQYYKFLGAVNIVISGITTVEGTNENLRNYVKGEALVWRAFAYFKLLQYYAPYKDDLYGVPVFLTPDQDIGHAMPARSTQKEVFRQIISDCREVLDLLDKTPSNAWNCAYRYDFIHAMLAGIYTWKAMSGAAETTDWENAEKSATEAMTGRTLANSPAVLKQMFDCKKVTPETEMVNDEFYFRIMDGNVEQVGTFAGYYKGMSAGVTNLEYYIKFKDGDIRKAAYFKNGESDKYNLKGEDYGSCFILFRLAEMYLIKAEALVRQGRTGEAHDVLQEFKQARYTGTVEIPSTPDALLQEILDERIREFYMENDCRWLDMKRLGVEVERVVGGEKIVLRPDDFRYCFPIPKKEIELNKNIVQTPGWDQVMF